MRIAPAKENFMAKKKNEVTIFKDGVEVTPADPVTPAAPADPVTPAAPADPVTPAAPADPVTPAAPADRAADLLTKTVADIVNETEPPLAAPVTADELLTPKRGPGRPKGSTKNQARDESGHFVKPGPAPLAVIPDFAKLGEMVFDLSTGTLSMALGPEWKPQSPEERAMVSNAIGQYLKSKEISDIPPGVMLAVVVLAYSAPRLNAPSTKEKIARGWLWLKAKFTRRAK